MIFVTVGTQLPFDRLVRAVDEWSSQRDRPDVFAQIGAGGQPPATLEWSEQVTPEAFRERLLEASMIVSHAGIGTILTALELRKPIVVMPRRADLGEHRNDHQLATARHLCVANDVPVVEDVAALGAWLDDTLACTIRRPAIASHASFELLAAVRSFIDDTPLTNVDAPPTRLPSASPPGSRADAA